ncbi:MAG: hypothetical protein DRI01_07800 [Chloroflexi bacterium]|nr:MAG: hypothetical protein DRI01_07800 [Chloroflexota bacterium]
MGRLPKCRRVGFVPQITYFKPAGIPVRLLEEVCLSVEEGEAIRLKDLEGLEQEECARRMHISRPTFHRVLGAARQKVADALLSGKAIRIEGGNYEVDTPFTTMVAGQPGFYSMSSSLGVVPARHSGYHGGRRNWSSSEDSR